MDLEEIRGIKVFVVDDNSNNLSLIKDYLLQYDLHPIPLKSGEAAIELISKVVPDIILLDVQMKYGIDGFETCRRIKSREEFSSIPVIFVSAFSETVDKVKGFSVGGVDYITKPMDMEELISRIYVHIKISRLQEELNRSKNSLEEEVTQRTKELKESFDKLRDYKEFLSNIINAMPSMIFVVNSDSRIILWNKKVSDEPGVDISEGSDITETVEFLSDIKEIITESFKNRIVKEKYRKEAVINSEQAFLDIYVFPLSTSQIDGAVIRVDNITERVHMEELMVQSEKMMSIGGLAAGMAHEINNPLAAIIQSASLLENRLVKKLDNEATLTAAREVGLSLESLKSFIEKRNITTILDNIKKSGKRLSEIVTNMLGFVYKSKSDYSFQSVIDIVEQCISLASMDYNMKKKYDFKLINIIKEFDKNIPDVQCDRTKIEQVFLNILQNGAMAMSMDKTPEPTFIVRVMNDNNYIRVEIEDNGPGIKEEIKHRIFDPFFTTKALGIGTGLGLSIAYYIIVKEHKGIIKTKPAVNKGTVFIIKIPVKRDK